MEIVKQENIQNQIFSVRGVQVMLDSDLASIYQTETKFINRAVKRNPLRFPEEFMFQLTEKEWTNLKFQFGTSREHGGRRTLPFVFTEQGVAMLSAVLNTERAIIASIQIMQAFVAMRKFLQNNASEELKTSHDRFLMIDQKELYHLGASLKDLGKKWFAFSKLEGNILDMMLGQIKKEVVI